MSQASARTGHGTLGYAFAPVPRWILADVAAGLLSTDMHALIAGLYGFANTERLAARQPTPTPLRLETIAASIRWSGELESLRRQLGRLRESGRYFTYKVDGNSRTTQRYAFTLLPDEPESASDQRPPVQGAARPPVQAPEHVSGSRLEPVDVSAASARPEHPKSEACPPVVPCLSARSGQRKPS